MNVANLNIVSKPSVNKSIDSNNSALSDKDENPNNFANALDHQEKRLKETSKKDDIAQPQEKVKNQASDEEKPNENNGQKELVALLEQYLPLAKADNVNPSPELASSYLTAELPTPETNTPAADATATSDIANAMTLTGTTLAKPMPEQAQANRTTENTTQEVSLPKQMVFAQSIQNGQSSSLPSTSTEYSDAFHDTLTSVTESGTSASGVRTEAPILQKLIDTRTESYTIAKSVTHPGWSKDLGEHIIWMNNKDITAAEIKLNPANLGPISVRIDVNQDNQATILFTAQHTETKEALEASVPKLREMLNGQQLNLVNVNISQNSNSPHGRQQSQLFQDTTGNSGSTLETLATESGMNEKNHLVSKGLLSLYA